MFGQDPLPGAGGEEMPGHINHIIVGGHHKEEPSLVNKGWHHRFRNSRDSGKSSF
jgi:hypothetical protein